MASVIVHVFHKAFEKHNGSMDKNAMIEILKDHNSGIRMHGSFGTTSSMVSELRRDGSAQHWMTGKPHPRENEFLPQNIKGDMKSQLVRLSWVYHKGTKCQL